MSELRRTVASINEDVLAAMDMVNQEKNVLGELGSIGLALNDLEEDVAKVIAERDELLASCKELLRTSENIDKFYHSNLLLHAHAMWERARAAIAKAEGKSND